MSCTTVGNCLAENAGIIIALLAFFATFWQAYISRRHNRLSVIPNLTTWTHQDDHEDGHHLSVDLLNNGVGPANIKEFKVYVDGVQIAADEEDLIEQALRALFSEYKFDLLHSSYFLPDYMMGAGEKRVLLHILFDRQSSPSREIVNQLMSKARLKIVYESIYQETKDFDTEKKGLN
jgi:hypothetical protein